MTLDNGFTAESSFAWVNTLNRPRRSSLLRFSLRTAIIGTLIAALGFAYVARQDAQRRRLIADIEAAGGSVKFDNSIFAFFQSARVSEVKIPHARVSDVGMPRLKSLSHLSELTLTDFDGGIPDGPRFKASEIRIFPVTEELLDELKSTIVSESSVQP